ncbi:uncharacterized protein LOC107210488 isoform X2 [Parus major]|uniref:uncharacterized protein LOC107210488 isoform X2 n=1 Tax=Parus major TaxID=9157 RepID=UPI00077105E4|nr:uncharacterized protein LOC107210488 isoform X2 [Parus major]
MCQFPPGLRPQAPFGGRILLALCPSAAGPEVYSMSKVTQERFTSDFGHSFGPTGEQKFIQYYLHFEMESASMSNEGPENPIASTLTEGMKRKRGRPKKKPQEDGGNTAVIPQDGVEPQPVKKPRGRPKGSKKLTTITGGMKDPSAGKRPRGRPRKWPQAVVQEGESEGGNPLESSDSNLNSAPATQGLTGSRSGKTTGLRRCLSNIPAAAQ